MIPHAFGERGGLTLGIEEELFVVDAESLEPAPVPPEVLETMGAVWADEIANSKALKDYAADRGALFTPYHGEDAQERAMGMVRQNAWLLYDAGKTLASG